MGTANRERVASTALRDRLFPAVEQTLRYSYSRRDDLPALCDEIGLPDCPYEERFTRLKYIQARLAKITGDDQLREVAANFVNRYPLRLRGNAAAFEIEELLWRFGEREVPRWVRRKLAAGLVHADLFTDAKAFLEILGRLFVIETDADAIPIWRLDERPLLEKICEDFIKNRLWSVKELFHELGAFTCTGERFCTFIEALAGSQARPTKASQRFITATNSALKNTGFELVKTSKSGGFPDFSLEKLSDPKTPLYRFYDKWSEPYRWAVLFFWGFLGSFFSLWISTSILYFVSKHYAASPIALLFTTIYLLFLCLMLKALRWSIVRVAFPIASLCMAIYSGITDPSRSLWIVPAAGAITAFVLAFVERERGNDSTEETFVVKLGGLFYATTRASALLAGVLVALAWFFEIEWFLAEEFEFIQELPYIKFVFLDWPLDD